MCTDWKHVSNIGVTCLDQVENQGGEGQVMQASLACHGSSALTSSRERPLEDPNVMFVGAFSGKLVERFQSLHIVFLCLVLLLLHLTVLPLGQPCMAFYRQFHRLFLCLLSCMLSLSAGTFYKDQSFCLLLTCALVSAILPSCTSSLMQCVQWSVTAATSKACRHQCLRVCNAA